MATLQLSNTAKGDLLRIGAYTIETWGVNQAERYLGGLEECVRMLAKNPSLGRSCAWIRPELRRFEKGRHVIFYRELANGIVVLRILHLSVLPEEQTFEDDLPEA